MPQSTYRRSSITASLDAREIDKNKIKLNKLPIIELKDLVMKYGDSTVLNKINLKIYEGEFVTILGPSGSGKSTILSLIGGFIYPTRGEIIFQGKDVKDLLPHLRPTSTIFQDYSLFTQLNVEDNIKYGLKLIRTKVKEKEKKFLPLLKEKQKKWRTFADLKMKALDQEQQKYSQDIENLQLSKKKRQKAQKWLDDSDFKYSYWENYYDLKTAKFQKNKTTRRYNKDEMNKIVHKMLDLVGLQKKAKASIDSLSGGMKQRVALARSLAIEPKILLLDEPLSALDAKIRKKMQRLLVNIQDDLGKTFIFVTHDQEEALELSDRVIVIREGIVEQFDTPKNIYEHPANRWVASFVGDANLFEGEITLNRKLKIGSIQFELPSKYDHFQAGTKVDVLIRPEDVVIDFKHGYLQGYVNDWTYKGSYYFTEATVEGKPIYFETNKFHEYKTSVFLSWSLDAIHIMAR